MNYGLYLSASGALTSLYQQDVYANNLANSQTIGFKRDFVYFQQRLPERIENNIAVDPQHMLEQLGGGRFAMPNWINFEQGELAPTGRPLDVAIRGEGFFVVNSGRGEGAERLRFTRDGRFMLNASGDMVMSATGMQVLDVNDRPINLAGGGDVRIESTGEVVQDGDVVARIQVTQIPEQSQLRKAGDNLFMLTNTAQVSRRLASVALEQGFVESSTVDPVTDLNAVISAGRNAQANTKMMQYHDQLMNLAINTMGRVA